VPEVRRIAKISLVALAVGAVGAVLARLRRPVESPPALPDERTEELRRKLAEARAAAADQEDFEVAGMGAETIVEEAPRPEPEAPPAEAEARPAVAEAEAEPAPASAEVEPAQPEPPAAEAEPAPPADAAPPPQDEFEAMRRRIHEEGKKAAEDMRRSADPPDKP
jgi:hypothetical protein